MTALKRFNERTHLGHGMFFENFSKLIRLCTQRSSLRPKNLVGKICSGQDRCKSKSLFGSCRKQRLNPQTLQSLESRSLLQHRLPHKTIALSSHALPGGGMKKPRRLVSTASERLSSCAHRPKSRLSIKVAGAFIT